MDKRVFLCLAKMGGTEMSYIDEAFASQWVAPLGPNVEAFETLLSQYTARRVVALNSGTSALHLALLLSDVKQGDEVICSSFTFCASANPIKYCGATPIFVDSESSTWNMSHELLAEAIEQRIRKNRKPKAIIAVDLYGMPCNYDALLDIASKYEIPVIEDSCEALGSSFNGKRCGSLTPLAAFSFNGNKMITTSGGGALVCANEEQREKALFLATQAREKGLSYYQHETIGFNYRMSNICAGIGRGQMGGLEHHIKNHKMLHDLYLQQFASCDDVVVPTNPDPRFDSNFWLTTLLLSEKKKSHLENIIKTLDSKGVEVRRLWKPLHLQPVFKDAPSVVDGTSESLFSRGICLPSGPCVTEDDVMKITEIIKKCLLNSRDKCNFKSGA